MGFSVLDYTFKILDILQNFLSMKSVLVFHKVHFKNFIKPYYITKA